MKFYEENKKNDAGENLKNMFDTKMTPLMYIFLYPLVLLNSDYLGDFATNYPWIFRTFLFYVCASTYLLCIGFSLINEQKRPVINFFDNLPLVKSLKVPPLSVLGLFLLFSLGLVDASHAGFPWKIQFILAFLLVFCVSVLLGASAVFAVRKVVDVLLVRPVWFLMGTPDHPDMVRSPVTEPVAESSKVTQIENSTNTQKFSRYPDGNYSDAQVVDDSQTKDKVYDFDWVRPKIKLENLAGMSALKNELLTYMQAFTSYQTGRGPISDRNGFLLSGPPGNGKTVFAEAIAGELGLRFVRVSCQDINSKWLNESPSVLKSLFKQAKEVPTLIFFDEFDSVAMSRTGSSAHNEERKGVTALLVELDKARDSRVVVVAASNHLEFLDSAVIRDGRFDFRIEIPYPDEIARAAILKGLVKKHAVTAEEKTINYVAALWERRSVAFLEATVKRLRDNGKGIKGRKASVEDFKEASRDASRRASAIPSSGTKLSDLALPADVRREADSLVYRLRNWERIAERGGEAPSGVLLYGPPGTGKTNLVRAIAREMEYWHVFEVNATEVLQNPRKFRDTVELAATHRPAFIFIDEADELLRDRSYSNSAGATNEILKCMDGMMGKIPEIVFIAATNNTEVIDAAALRGGRFAEKIFMGRLTGGDLIEFLEKEFASKKQVHFAQDLTPRALAARFDTIAPSDAIGILRKAINYTFGQDGKDRAVCMQDVERAIEATTL